MFLKKEITIDFYHKRSYSYSNLIISLILSEILPNGKIILCDNKIRIRDR